MEHVDVCFSACSNNRSIDAAEVRSLGQPTGSSFLLYYSTPQSMNAAAFTRRLYRAPLTNRVHIVYLVQHSLFTRRHRFQKPPLTNRIHVVYWYTAIKLAAYIERLSPTAFT